MFQTILILFFILIKINGKLIAGGQSTPIEKIPYIVSLQTNETGTHFCGGSIIGSKWILTAAHCTENSDQYYVRAGSNFHSYGGNIYNIKRIIIHPNWNSTTIDADIALLELNQSIPVTPKTNSIKLLEKQDENISEIAMVRVAGWGKTDEFSSANKDLQSVMVLTVKQDICQQFYPDTQLTECMICAELPDEGKGACSMDSGGPLVYRNSYLIGIVSWGSGCGGSYPGVYTKVSHFRNWIKTITGI